MFEQMVKDMWVPPDILAQLTDEQKDVLHYEIRQEQIRRYNEWQKTAENTKGSPRVRRKLKLPTKRKKEKRVTFVEGPDGKLVVQKLHFEPRSFSPPYSSMNGKISIVRANDDQITRTSVVHYNEDDPRPRARSLDVRTENSRTKLTHNIVIVAPPPQRLTQQQHPVILFDHIDGQQSRTPLTVSTGRYGNVTTESHEEDLKPTSHTFEEPYSSTMSIQLRKSYENSIPIKDLDTYEPPETVKRTEIIQAKSIPTTQRVPSRKPLEKLPSVNTEKPTIEIRRTSTTELIVTARDQLSSSTSNLTNPDRHGIAVVPIPSPDLLSESESDLSLPVPNQKGFQRIHLAASIQTPARLHTMSPIVLNNETANAFTASIEHGATNNTSTGDSNTISPPPPSPGKLEKKRPMFLSTEDLNRLEWTPNGLHRRPSQVSLNRSSERRNQYDLSSLAVPNPKVSAEIRRRQQQLFKAVQPPVPKSEEELDWFLSSEAPRLMVEFGLPPSGHQLSNSTFKSVPKWFHGRLSKFQAEQLVRRVGVNGAYLLRVSSIYPGYAITWLWDDLCHHQLVSVISPDSENQQQLQQQQPPHGSPTRPSYQLYPQPNAISFASLRELVNFYSINSISETEYQCLLHAAGQPPQKSDLPDYADLFYPDVLPTKPRH